MQSDLLSRFRYHNHSLSQYQPLLPIFYHLSRVPSFQCGPVSKPFFSNRQRRRGSTLVSRRPIYPPPFLIPPRAALRTFSLFWAAARSLHPFPDILPSTALTTINLHHQFTFTSWSSPLSLPLAILSPSYPPSDHRPTSPPSIPPVGMNPTARSSRAYLPPPINLPFRRAASLATILSLPPSGSFTSLLQHLRRFLSALGAGLLADRGTRSPASSSARMSSRISRTRTAERGSRARRRGRPLPPGRSRRRREARATARRDGPQRGAADRDGGARLGTGGPQDRRTGRRRRGNEVRT